MIAFGLDVGAHSALALCTSVPNQLPRLLRVWPITGSTDKLWIGRAEKAIELAWVAASVDESYGRREDLRCWIEHPVPTVRAGPFAHHASGFGLGRRTGMLELLWYQRFGAFPTVTTPSRDGWWVAWRNLLALTGKSKARPGWRAGWERVEQASVAVQGAREMLAGVGEVCRVDCAEAILIAGAAVLSGGA